MRLTAQVKLQPNSQQLYALGRTLQTANQACNYTSEVAWETKTFRQFNLHKVVYYDIRERFGLAAEMTIRVIAKVANSYKLDKKTQRFFNPTGAFPYDNRILSWNLDKSIVSIWTMEGRLKIPFICGPHQRELLKTQRGESDLILFRGNFYIVAVCDVDEPTPKDVEGVLGIDLGIVNIATTSDGETFAGNQVNNVRHRHRRLRKKLQKKQTKSANRRLKKLSGKEARFSRYTNHVISKQIVATAQGTNRAIALEALKGIRDRVTARKSQRATLHSWSFYQLKLFISYKAQLAGVPLFEVDPKNTSRTCPACGCIDKANRKSQSNFLCTQCGFAGLADYIASVNIGRRALVNAPNVSTTFAIGSSNRSMAVVSQGQAPN